MIQGVGLFEDLNCLKDDPLTFSSPFQLSARQRITRVGRRAQSPAERDYECAPGSTSMLSGPRSLVAIGS